ncbi:MAG: hypothetical protein ACRELC_11690 [Gemmatimonadota bacterium]
MTEEIAMTIMEEARHSGMPGSARGGLSRLWIPTCLLAAAILAAIASVKAGALPVLGGKVLLGATIPLFFAMAFAAIRMDSQSGRKVPSLEPPFDEELEVEDFQQAPEVERVYRWRGTRLSRLGLDEELTDILAAKPGFSVHELERLLGKGCPLGTALRILQPD